MKDKRNSESVTHPASELTRARAIETDADGRRPLRAILDDARHLYELAIGRVWKGNPHPDFNGAGNALKLEADLSGYLAREAKRPTPDEPREWDQLVQDLRRAGYELRPVVKS